MSEMTAMRSPLNSLGHFSIWMVCCRTTSRLGSMKKAQKARLPSSTRNVANVTRILFAHTGGRPHSDGPGHRLSSWIRKSSNPSRTATAMTNAKVINDVADLRVHPDLTGQSEGGDPGLRCTYKGKPCGKYSRQRLSTSSLTSSR